MGCLKLEYYQNTDWRINYAGKELTSKSSSETLRSNLPFGELFVEQRSTANYYTPYKFSGKEKDEETSYSYFGARYYMSDVSIWLSVDPMRDKYPNMSPYNYCALNPIRISDPDGRDIDPTTSGYDEAKKAATPDSKSYQPAFAELYKKWEDNHSINVQFNNNMAESNSPDQGGTIEYGGEDKGGLDGKTRDVYKVFWDPKITEQMGTSGMFEEAKHLDDGLSGNGGFDIKTGCANFTTSKNEVEAKVWVAENIEGISKYSTQNGNREITQYQWIKNNVGNSEKIKNGLIGGAKVSGFKNNDPSKFREYKVFGTGNYKNN